jgi:hypothetical protein
MEDGGRDDMQLAASCYYSATTGSEGSQSHARHVILILTPLFLLRSSNLASRFKS